MGGRMDCSMSGQDLQIGPSLPLYPHDEPNITRVSCGQAYPLDDENKPRGTAGAMGYASVIYKASACEGRRTIVTPQAPAKAKAQTAVFLPQRRTRLTLPRKRTHVRTSCKQVVSHEDGNAYALRRFDNARTTPKIVGAAVDAWRRIQVHIFPYTHG